MPLKSKPHVLRSEMRKLRNEPAKELFNLCDELQATPGDVVFLCQDDKPVECNSEILLIVSPMIRRIIKGSLQTSYLLPKDFKIYISVEFSSKVILTLLDMIYHQKRKVIAKEHIKEFKSLATSLDIDDSNFVNADQTPDVEDDAIVDVINDLMEEYNVNPNQTQNELEELLMTTLDESFINDTTGEISSFESLLSEPLDLISLNKETGEKAMEEDSEKIEVSKAVEMSDKVKRGPKKRKIKPTKHRLRECGVDIENLSNQTLLKYYSILKNKNEKNPRESVSNTVDREGQEDSKETNTDSPKRKRKAKSFPGFDIDSVKKVTKKGSVTVLNESSNDSCINDKTSSPEVAESTFQEEYVAKSEAVTSSLDSGSHPSDMTKADSDLQIVSVKKIKCFYCEEYYTTRSRILQHLSVSHFQSQILTKHPFVRGECTMCVELGRPKPITAKNKQVHLLHVGSLHEKVIEFIPEAFKSNIEQEFPMRKRNMKLKIKDEPLDTSNISNISSVNDDSIISNDSSFVNISNIEPNVCSSSFEVSFQDSFTKSLLSSNINIVKPNPVVSPVKTKTAFFPQVNEDANHAPSSPAPSVSSGSSQEAKGLLSCSLCPVTDIHCFQYKSQMLSHLSLVHLPNELLTLFPFPLDGNCQLCLKLNECFESKPVENFSDNETYIEHVGSHHEKVLEILPTDICDKINALQTEAAVVVTQGDSGHGSKDASILDISFESSLNSTAIGEDFSQSPVLDDSSLARFVELSQKVTTNEPSSALAMSILKCKNCPEIFTSAEERLINIRNVHTKRKVYNCRYCDAAFKDPKQFKLHLLAHKKDLVQQ